MWVKSIVGSNQFIDAIKCKIYGKSERKLKFIGAQNGFIV
jgi:hypothetical protein